MPAAQGTAMAAPTGEGARPVAAMPMLPPTPAAPAAVAPAPPGVTGSASTPPTAPAQQVATVVAKLLVRPGQTRLDLTLNPQALGHVAIRIDRAANGSAAVQILVERPETLAALHRDAPQLQAALDRAGLPATGCRVTLALAPEASRAAPAPGSAPDAGAFTRGFGTGGEPHEQKRPRTPRRSRARAAAFPAVNITA